MNTRHQTRSVVRKTTLEKPTFALLLLTAVCFVITFTRSTEASVQEASGAVNNDDGNWRVFYAQCFNADDFDGNMYVTRRISGASINNEGTTVIPPPNEGASLPPKASLPADSPQVTDFAQDVQVGSLGVRDEHE